MPPQKITIYSGVSGVSGDADPRTTELLRLLARMEPLIRRRIREIRGSRDALLSTSGLYATVVEEVIVGESAAEDTDHAEASPKGDPATGPETASIRNLPEIIRDAVTSARRAVQRWRQADGSFAEDAGRASLEPLAPLDRGEFMGTMQRLIDGLAREDREILYLRMKGNSWASVAAATGLRDITCRQRWVRMVAELRRLFPHD